MEGRRLEALSAAHQGLSFIKNIESGQNESIQKQWADARRSLSHAQSQMGEREEAHSSIRDAVEVYRKLTEQNPEAFGYDLASCLKVSVRQTVKLGFKGKCISVYQRSCGYCKKTCRAQSRGLQFWTCLVFENPVRQTVKLGF